MWNGFPRIPRIKVNRSYQLVLVVGYSTIVGTIRTLSGNLRDCYDYFDNCRPM